MALTQTQVSQLYVSIFNRASEGDGNTNWQTKGTMDEVANLMLATPDAQDYFGSSLSNQEFIETIYKNTLNKTLADDEAGIANWTAKLESGMTRGEVVAEIIEAIYSYAPDAINYDPNDQTTINAYNQFINRVDVSDYMALHVKETPADYKTTTQFAPLGELVVTANAATITTAKASVDALKRADGDTGMLTTSLATLKAANEAVTAKEEEKAEFLKAAYSNENVKDKVTETNNADGLNKVNSADVIEADIASAHSDTATVLVGLNDAAGTKLIAGTGAAFNDLTDAQQNAKIAAAQVDLQADIDAASKTVAEKAKALESGVAALVAEVNKKAAAVEATNNALYTAKAATAVQITRADVLVTDTTAGSTAFTYTASTNTLEYTDGTNTAANILKVSATKVELDTAVVTLNAKGTEYTIKDGDDNATIAKADLDALVAAAQAEYDAYKADQAAQTALQKTIIKVLNAQDTAKVTDYVTADVTIGAATSSITISDSTDGKDAAVVIDYTKNGDITAAAIATDLKGYAAAVDTLATAKDNLATFKKALADWKATETLVDELAALNETLTELKDAAKDAEKAITNPTTDKDAPGLGINLADLDAGETGTASEADIFLLGKLSKSITNFDADLDSIFVGTGFTLFAVSNKDAKIKDNLGDPSVLEAIVLDDGTDTTIYFEQKTFAGNSSSTTADMVTVTLTGVTGQEVSIDANGFLTIA